MKDLKNLDCLLPNTKELLLQMIDSCSFLNKYVLVGGSAMTLHLCHRKSEDLDFFTFNNDFDKKEIFEYIQSFQSKEIINQTDEQVDILINGVKVTFFNAQWSFLRPKVIKKFNLASIDSIATMKLNALFLRAKYRDYYDMYYLVKECLSLKEIFEASEHIVAGITFKLFAVALVYIDDIEDENIDYLQPKERISKEKIRNFFEKRLE